MEIECDGWASLMRAFENSLMEGDVVTPADDPCCSKGPRFGWMIEHADRSSTYVLLPYKRYDWYKGEDVALCEILRNKSSREAWESDIGRLAIEARRARAAKLERCSAPGARWDEII